MTSSGVVIQLKTISLSTSYKPAENDIEYFSLWRSQLSMTVLKQAFEHIQLFFSIERCDFKEALFHDRSDEPLAADDATDVVAKVTHRQFVGGVGRQDNVDVLRPWLR